jgi:type IV pilus assembly protein PilQ
MYGMTNGQPCHALKFATLLASVVCASWCTTAHAENAVPSSQPAVLMKPGHRVELHVVDVPLKTVLRMLSTQSRRNIISSSGVQGMVTAHLFDVTFQEAMESILIPNGCTYVERGNFIHVYTFKELADQQAASGSNQLVARLFHLNYVTTADVEPIIRSLLSSDGKLAAMPDATKTESGSGMGSSMGGSLAGGGAQVGRGNLLSRPDVIMVCDYPDRLAQVEKVIADLDVRPRQVLVEATILRASLSEQNSLGIDFNILGGVNFENLGAISQGVTDIRVGQVPQSELAGSSFTVRTDFNQAVARGGFTFGFIHNDVAMFIRALEAVSDATVLANPKVLTLNRQEGHVIVGRRDGYITTTITETIATQTVEFLETGTRLYFRPFIAADGFVRMEIHPEDSSGGIDDRNLPFKRTTEVTTNIMVRDGHTVLIGGLFREAASITKSQVPYAGNIPIVGALLQTNTDLTEREEIIILLTVHIVKEDPYAAESARMAEGVERLRIGMRKGLQAYGRNRLAQAHYRWAVEHAEAGRLDKALWDTRLALHMAPTHMQALQLKDQLLQRRELERGDGFIREFINRRLLGTPEEIVVPWLPQIDDGPVPLPVEGE